MPEEYFNFIDNDLRQVYHAMVQYPDDVGGKIIGAFKEKDLWDNLLFITSSDNGGPVSSEAAANNYPLKGMHPQLAPPENTIQIHAPILMWT